MYNDIIQLNKDYDFVLGSGSPRRVKLLNEIGVSFTQIIPDIDEIHKTDELPLDYVLRLAKEKALSVSKQLLPNQLVISCDTIVVLENRILGKPKDTDDAFSILSSLSGKKHTVHTSLAIADTQQILAEGTENTIVYFNSVPAAKIKEYINTGEPTDKAGAYGIQGMGAFLVDRIEGNLDTVIGFPRGLLNNLAKRIINLGIDKRTS